MQLYLWENMSSSLPEAADDGSLYTEFLEKVRLLQQKADDDMCAKCGYVKAQLFSKSLFTPARYAKFTEAILKKATPIFNQTTSLELNDDKRRQFELCGNLFKQFPELRRLDNIIRKGFGKLCGKLILEGHVLLSLAGCAVQEPHCDYPFDLSNSSHFLVRESDKVKRELIRAEMYQNSRRSFVFFYAFESDTSLLILDPSGVMRTVHVQKGEALIASGFVIHAGNGKAGNDFCYIKLF